MNSMPSSLPEYIAQIVQEIGSDLALGNFLGLAGGSRVGYWRKGYGRPSELMCIKIARWRGDDPLAVLRLADYGEMADLLAGVAVPIVTASNTHSVTLLRSQLGGLRAMIDAAMDQAAAMGDTHHAENPGTAKMRH